MTTHNGFSKAEMYRSIEVHMTRRAYETACCQMAELCCSRNEVNGYIGYLCDYFGKHCLHGNIWLATHLARSIAQIGNMPKRKLSHDRDFQQRICELTMLLSVTPIKNHTKLNNPKYGGYLNQVEPLLYRDDVTGKYKRVIEDAFQNTLTAEMRKMFAVLYYLVKIDSRKEMVILLNYLTSPGLQGVVQIPRRLPEGIRPAQAGDMVWPLWHMVFEFPVNKHVREYLEHMWFIYGFSYDSKSRAARMNILFMAYMAAMRPDSLENREIRDPIIPIACAKIRVAFGDVLKMDFEKEDRAKAVKHEEAEKKAARIADKAVKAEQKAVAAAATAGAADGQSSGKKSRSKKSNEEGGEGADQHKDPYKYAYLQFYTHYGDEDGEGGG